MTIEIGANTTKFQKHSTIIGNFIQVFIDGKSGTTGLLIKEKLAKHKEIQLFRARRSREIQDIQKKSEIVNQSDLVILCLPDASAKETVSLVKNPTTKIIDASTAHRVHPDWVYGFAEMSQGQKDCHSKSNDMSATPAVML